MVSRFQAGNWQKFTALLMLTGHNPMPGATWLRFRMRVSQPMQPDIGNAHRMSSLKTGGQSDMRPTRAISLLVIFIAAVGTTASWRRPSAKENVTNDPFQFNAASLKDTTMWTKVNLQPYAISSQLDTLCRAPMAANYEPERI